MRAAAVTVPLPRAPVEAPLKRRTTVCSAGAACSAAACAVYSAAHMRAGAEGLPPLCAAAAHGATQAARTVCSAGAACSAAACAAYSAAHMR